MSDTYYDALGLSRSANDKQIRDAYRRLAREHHPDVNPGDPQAETRFKRVNEAYHVLSNEKRRKDYDEFGEHWARADDIRKAGGRIHFGRGVGPAGAEFFDFGGGGFGDTFSRFGFGGPRPTSSTAQAVNVEIGLREAHKGTTRTITYRRAEQCSVCGGAGIRSQTVCANCEGHGATDRPVRLEVKIPAGIDDGGRVRLRPDPDSEIILRVSIRPDRTFRRTGPDLHTTVTAPYTDLVLGGEVEVPAMNGAVALKIPAGTQNGKVFRLSGKGMPRQGGGGAGTLYVTVSARFPESLSDEERDLFERLRTMSNGVSAAAKAEAERTPRP